MKYERFDKAIERMNPIIKYPCKCRYNKERKLWEMKGLSTMPYEWWVFFYSFAKWRCKGAYRLLLLVEAYKMGAI